MRNLLNFIIKYSYWFLFTIYIVAGMALLVIGNSYRQSVYLSSANYITGTFYNFTSEVTSYFNLKSVNNSLQESNSRLQAEVLNLKNRLAHYETVINDTLPPISSNDRFNYISASVINNNTQHPKNYFTINQGALDGVKTGMGVIDQNGIVGIVDIVGPHLSRIISVLNESQHFSVKLKNTKFVGSMNWKGNDPTIAYVEEIPLHTTYHIGDTVVTSGYSTTFPEGLPVGRILNKIKSKDDSFYTFKIKLSPNFRSLSSVKIIKDMYKAEIDSLANIDQSNN